jgi:hypothetical protein
MILADASVWINHLNGRQKNLSFYILEEQVIIHSFVIGEIALGHIKNRKQVLRDLHLLPPATPATDSEVLELVERNQLFGKGIGWVDSHLLLSALLSDAELWTDDKALIAAARSCGAKVRA